MSTRPVGEILKAARNEKGLTLDQVSRQTKIRTKYLHSIEQSRWRDLPGVAYIIGFVKRYAEAVGLDPDKVALVFKREFTFEQNQDVLPESFKNPPLNRSAFFLTIRKILSKLIG